MAELKMSQFREVPENQVDPGLPKSVREVEIIQDPTEELLGSPIIDPAKVTAEVDMKPLFQQPWVVRALDDELNERLVGEATKVLENPRTKAQQRQMDTAEYSRLIIYHCTVTPNLKDPRIIKKYQVGGTQHALLVKLILNLPGYAERVSSKIMEVSGFSDQYVEVAKNSLKEGG